MPLVRILGGGEQHNYPSDDIYGLVSGCDAFAERMYAQAGCGPEDLDFAQLYDDYPVMAFIQLEGLGLTRPGETAEFVRDKGRDGARRFSDQHRRRPAQRRSGGSERRDDRRL